MAEKPASSDDKDRVAIPLDPEEALRALLKVDPDSDPAPDGAEPPAKHTQPLS